MERGAMLDYYCTHRTHDPICIAQAGQMEFLPAHCGTIGQINGGPVESINSRPTGNRKFQRR